MFFVIRCKFQKLLARELLGVAEPQHAVAMVGYHAERCIIHTKTAERVFASARHSATPLGVAFEPRCGLLLALLREYYDAHILYSLGNVAYVLGAFDAGHARRMDETYICIFVVLRSMPAQPMPVFGVYGRNALAECKVLRRRRCGAKHDGKYGKQSFHTREYTPFLREMQTNSAQTSKRPESDKNSSEIVFPFQMKNVYLQGFECVFTADRHLSYKAVRNMG